MKAVVARPRLRMPRLGVGPQVVVVLLVLSLFGAMAIEPTRQLMSQRARIAGVAQDLQQIERSNDRLAGRIDRLQDPDFLEQRAREIGLVRPGEDSIVVMPPSKKMQDHKKPDKKRPKSDKVRPLGFFEGFLNFVGII
ncbi:MAG TPA: septum formation initiator family protein [Actinomycetota bacterium]|nr:septum formation initiator family protein [Actinomycetota bacterium]